MLDTDRIPKELLALLKEKHQGEVDAINFPPPVFDAMQAEFVAYDAENERLTNRFPVLQEQLNPYGTMQGGIIAAAIDNTVGPLSMLVAPPNFTRGMELKFRKVVSPELGFIYVTASFVKKEGRQLFFEAVVTDSDGVKHASAQSTHWVID